MAKNKIEIPEDLFDSFSDQAEQTAVKTMETEATKGQRKPGHCFLKLDLMPEGYDLKTYCMRRSGELSAELGRPVSATAYIQSLIKADMARQQTMTDREQTCQKIRVMPEKEYLAIRSVIDLL